MDISGALINWYLKHQRDLPWRHTRDPYRIWLSEIILQQTRVEQGLPYYERFLKAFPDIRKLAQASEDQVLKLWQGLGYYSRARNLRKTARIVHDQFNGKFPSDYQKIIKFPGIGEYTAAAISSFAWNLPHAVVDGNVNRFISRLYHIEDPINSTRGKKIFAEIAGDLLNKKKPGLHNQAIMEFGATWCKPVNPDCPNCIFITICEARKRGNVSTLPVKEKNLKVKTRHFHYLMVIYRGNIFMRKRPSTGIWQGLYELPYIETGQWMEPHQLTGTPEWKELFRSASVTIGKVGDPRIHKLTHQHIRHRMIEVRVDRTPESFKDRELLKVPAGGAARYPVPKPVELILKEFGIL